MRFFTQLLIVPTILVFFSTSLSQGNAAETRQISLIATDKNNSFISDLKKEELSVTVGGKEISDFTLTLQSKPSLHVLAIDNSGSLRPIFHHLMNGAKSIFSPNSSNNLTLLMRFVSRDKIQVAEKFSADPIYLESQFVKFQIEPGQTAVIDAIYKAAMISSEQKAVGDYMRAVVVISDGEDRDSSLSAKELKELITRLNVPVFFVGLTNLLSMESGFVGTSPRRKAIEFIEMVTTESGGVAIYPESSSDIVAAGGKIATLLNNRYVLSLQLSGTAGNDSKIEVKMKRNSKRDKIKFHFKRSLQ